MTKQERHRLAAEALRRGERDRAVELLNQNVTDDAWMVLTMVGMEFLATALTGIAAALGAT